MPYQFNHEPSFSKMKDLLTGNFFARLYETRMATPAGYERDAVGLWLGKAAAAGMAERWTDGMGNGFAALQRGGMPKILLSAHIPSILLKFH